jgi:tRNA nucleotidyltransferase (CCA-adding enzyme)
MVENKLLELFHQAGRPKPSIIYQTLIAYDLPLLLLISVRYPRQIGTYVWQYVTQLIHIRPPINGNHLKRLGYSPGPLYRQILAALTYAVLDGEITSLTSAEKYLHHHYPVESNP